jgi:hypothetical protein
MKVYIGRYPNDSEKTQTIRVRIDKWDTWSMDATLAHIIHPMLIQLRDTTHGYPGNLVDENFANGIPCRPIDTSDGDDPGAQRWTEILNKMIWSFHQLILDKTDEPNVPTPTNYHKMPQRRDNPEGIIEWSPEYNEEEYQEFKKQFRVYHDRMQEGFDLFGKYYQHLWD